MLKLAGLTGVVIIGTLVGLLFSSAMRQRQKRLGAVCLFIEELSDCIRRGMELGTILSEKGRAAGISFEGLRPVISREGLSREDAKLLEEFFTPLGLGDTDSQLKRCEVYLELLRRQEAAAIAQAKEKSGLYGRLGFFAGLFIAIMLI